MLSSAAFANKISKTQKLKLKKVYNHVINVDKKRWLVSITNKNECATSNFSVTNLKITAKMHLSFLERLWPFLAVQNSSIGDLVTHSLTVTDNHQEPPDNRQEPGTFTFDIQRLSQETCDLWDLPIKSDTRQHSQFWTYFFLSRALVWPNLII